MRFVGLLTLAILIPFTAYAALININTADIALLDTLPGVGPTLAGRIVDYRTANGPFTTIEGIQKVSGIGSGSTYAKIAPLITIGDTGSSSSSGTASSTASAELPTQEQTPSISSGSTQTPSFSLSINGPSDAIQGVPIKLSARATVKGGVIDPSARVAWGFGDGSSAEGITIEKMYRYAGEYLVVGIATDGTLLARDEFVVTVRPASVRILSVSSEGSMLTNDSNERLDLSEWILLSDAKKFRIPDGTIMLPKANVLFSSEVTRLTDTSAVTLLYPDGSIATRYEPPVIAIIVEQPSLSVASYEEVQAVEPIINTQPNIQIYDEAVLAPTAEVEPAAVGAVVTAVQESKTASTATNGFSGLLHSPWTFSLLGVIALAGGVFILL